MEKLSLDEIQDKSFSESGIKVPEDNVYTPSVEAPKEARDDPRSHYGELPPTEWPVYKYETKGGKGISIRHDEMGTLWRVEFVPGGQLPSELAGRFTNDSEAKHAVEQYLAKQD
jgi:hypothetical protein